jgi:RHS repeat-associated protein
VILLAKHDEPTLAAEQKRQLASLETATSTPKNRVWSFENTPSGRLNIEDGSSWENATGSVQYTYQNVSGRAEWLSRDPYKDQDGNDAEISQWPNLYAYVENDPLNFYDPYGLSVGSDVFDFIDSFSLQNMIGHPVRTTAEVVVGTPVKVALVKGLQASSCPVARAAGTALGRGLPLLGLGLTIGATIYDAATAPSGPSTPPAPYVPDSQNQGGQLHNNGYD